MGMHVHFEHGIKGKYYSNERLKELWPVSASKISVSNQKTGRTQVKCTKNLFCCCIAEATESWLQK
jgi:hypothetical protein